MKLMIMFLMIFLCMPLRAEELVVPVAHLPERAILIGKNRNLIPSVLYRISKGEIIFTGKKSDIDFLKAVITQGTLMPFFADAYQELSLVEYTITFQIRDPLYLINLSQELSCGSSRLRHSQCGNLSYYSSPSCRISPEILTKIESSLKVTSSLEDAKLLKVVTDNPCLNPKVETLYDFAIKTLSHRMAIGDFEGKIDSDFHAYLVTERPLELL